MDRWPFTVGSHSKSAILEAVDDEHWQEFRRSLKGLSTERKLDDLAKYRWVHRYTRDQIRVDNYINALKRGGQLNMDLEVVR